MVGIKYGLCVNLFTNCESIISSTIKANEPSKVERKVNVTKTFCSGNLVGNCPDEETGKIIYDFLLTVQGIRILKFQHAWK